MGGPKGTVRFFAVAMCVLLGHVFAVAAGQWKSYLESNGMPCQEVSALAVDGDLLWVGTFGRDGTGGGEILSFDMEKEEWESHSFETLTGTTVFSICVDNNRVWFGTDSGFVSFTKASAEWKVYPPSIGLPGQEVRDLAVFGDELWLVVYRKEGYESVGCGLTRFNLKRVECTTFTEKDGLPSATARFVDLRDGLLWLGTNSGLINFNPEYEQFALYFPGGLLAEDVRSMAVDKDTYWFGTENYTYSYSTSAGAWIEHDSGPTLVGHMLPTTKRLWVAPMIGLSSYDKVSGEWTDHQSRFLSETALSGLNVKALCATPEYLWVGTADGGLSRYTFDRDEHPLDGDVQGGPKTYPRLKQGYETPQAVLKTLVGSVKAGDVETMLGCFTPQTQAMLVETSSKRGMTPLNMFGRWFEGVEGDAIPDRLRRDIYRDLRNVLVDDRWLFDRKPEEQYEEEVQDTE